jgi:hypothetical protein
MISKEKITIRKVTEQYQSTCLAVAGQMGMSVQMMTSAMTRKVAMFDQTMLPEYIHV